MAAMRITAIAYGTRGDVQPAIALGRALQARGHRVRLVVGSDFAAMVERYGLEAAPADVAFYDVLASDAGQDMLRYGNGANFLKLVKTMRRLFATYGPAMMDGALRACEDADVVLSSFTSDVYAVSIAEKLGIAHLSASVQPALVATRSGAATASAPLPGRDSRINYHFSKAVVEPFNWRLMGGLVNEFRRSSLKLPSLDRRAYQARLRATPMVLGYSPHVVAPPEDWPATIHTTGYWFLDDDAGWQPPKTLTEFIAAGEPPVCVTFGAVVERDARALTGLVVRALRKAGQRGIIQPGWAAVDEDEPWPDTIYRLGPAPHRWLFQHARAVVYHGGAGTTAEALRAGVPAVAVPHTGDQPIWAARVAALGVGPRPVPRTKLTVDRLADAIRTAATDQPMRLRAAELGGKLRAEDGVAKAVDTILTYLPRPASPPAAAATPDMTAAPEFPPVPVTEPATPVGSPTSAIPPTSMAPPSTTST
jgi:sterol 3beta-glucosyltransferase